MSVRPARRRRSRLIGGLGLPHRRPRTSGQPAPHATPDPGRLVATVAALVGLAGVVIGGLALARSAGRIGTGNGRRGAIVALVAGLTGMVIGGLVVAAAEGGPGTGYGHSRWLRGPGGGADRHGPRRAGSGPLPPHRLTG